MTPTTMPFAQYVAQVPILYPAIVESYAIDTRRGPLVPRWVRESDTFWAPELLATDLTSSNQAIEHYKALLHAGFWREGERTQPDNMNVLDGTEIEVVVSGDKFDRAHGHRWRCKGHIEPATSISVSPRVLLEQGMAIRGADAYEFVPVLNSKRQIQIGPHSVAIELSAGQRKYRNEVLATRARKKVLNGTCLSAKEMNHMVSLAQQEAGISTSVYQSEVCQSEERSSLLQGFAAVLSFLSAYAASQARDVEFTIYDTIIIGGYPLFGQMDESKTKLQISRDGDVTLVMGASEYAIKSTTGVDGYGSEWHGALMEMFSEQFGHYNVHHIESFHASDEGENVRLGFIHAKDKTMQTRIELSVSSPTELRDAFALAYFSSAEHYLNRIRQAHEQAAIDFAKHVAKLEKDALLS